MLVPAEALLRGQADEQQAFSLVHAGAPGRVYCLGVETPTGVLALWLNPSTGKPMFGCYRNIRDAAARIARELGGNVPLKLVMDERPDEDVAVFYEEVVLVKAVVWQRV